MKPDILFVEPDISLFAIADRRLHERFNLLWGPTPEAAVSAMRKFGFDAVLVRAEELELIHRLHREHPDVPIIAIAPWEVQGDRAVGCGAKEWVSAPINFPRLAAVLDFAIAEARRSGSGTPRMAAAPA